MDASVAIGWFVWERSAERARRLLHEVAAGRLVLHAPDTWLAECASTIWKQVRLAHMLSPQEGAEAVARAARLEMVVAASAELLRRAYALAILHRCTIYDALYLALAEALAAPLATADNRLARLAHKIGVDLFPE